MQRKATPLAGGTYLTNGERLYMVVRSLKTETMLEDCGNAKPGDRFPCFSTDELYEKPWCVVVPLAT